MQTTSHFIGIELKSELFSDIFVKVYDYIRENAIEESVVLQNPLSPHITLYYLEKNLISNDISAIQSDIQRFDIWSPIYVTWINYFFRGDNRYVLYFNTKTDIDLESYRNTLHDTYKRIQVEDNSFDFSPHVTFLKIFDSNTFETHRVNIEKIISEEIEKIKDLDINSWKVYVYAVNSTYKEEIQIKL